MLNGYDISHWQSGLKPASVASDLVIVKATEGVGYVDKSCDPFYQAANGARRALGVYHYATGKSSATQEADYFVANIKGYIGHAVLILDWEAGVVKQGPAWALAWLNRVKATTGVTPIIYMSQSVTTSYNWDAVVKAGYCLWVAAYGKNNQINGYAPPPVPRVGHWAAPIMHQYSSRGRIKGWSGNLDLDVFYGSRADWDRLAAKGGSAPATPPTPAKPPTPAPPAASGTYTVKPGDTLTSIAKKFGTTWQKLYDLNKSVIGSNPNVIKVGQVLKTTGTATTAPAKTYTVKSGDNLTSIAKKFGTTWQKLYDRNKSLIGSNPSLIKPGQTLTIP